LGAGPTLTEISKVLEEQGFKVYSASEEPRPYLEVYVSEHERVVLIDVGRGTFISLDVYAKCPHGVESDSSSLSLRELRLHHVGLGLQGLYAEVIEGEDLGTEVIGVKGVIDSPISEVAKELRGLVEQLRRAVARLCEPELKS